MPTVKPVYPSMTSQWHTNSYPALKPEGRAANKVVVITRASSGIGRATAISFAIAGAKHLALIGRRKTELEETKKRIEQVEPKVKVTIHAISVTDLPALKETAAGIGKWDVLILSAGRVTTPAAIEDADPVEWWDVFETNMRGHFFASHAFLPTANITTNTTIPSKPTIISVSAAVLCLPPSSTPNTGASAYLASKSASLKIIEYLAAERPDITSISVHPGVVHTPLMERSGMMCTNEEQWAGAKHAGMIDEEELPAEFFVWSSTHEAEWLSGRFVVANWDMEELKGRKEEIEKSDLLTSGIVGWPFAHG